MAETTNRPNWGLWVGIGLIVLALIVAAVGLFVFNDLDRSRPLTRAPFDRVDPGDFDSLGEQIFFSGTDADGRYISRSGHMMNGLACADCHGSNAQGRTIGMMMGDIEAPDIRWSTLTDENGHGDETEAHEPYTMETFAQAVREGRDPAGERLSRFMPRWRLSDDEVEDLRTYLDAL